MKFDIHYLFVPRYAKWIIITLVSLFSILILISLSSLILTSLDTSKSILQDKKLENNSKIDTTNYLLDSPLFGVYVPPEFNEESVKKSLLDVTLVGVLLSNQERKSQVIIRSAGGEEKTYAVGDSIPGGALIKRITSAGVLVERDGSLESLSLTKEDLTIEPVPKPLEGE
jgi:general secretion pathway protein C